MNKYPYTAIKKIDDEIRVVICEFKKPTENTQVSISLSFWESRCKIIEFASIKEEAKCITHLIFKHNVNIDEQIYHLKQAIEVDCLVIDKQGICPNMTNIGDCDECETLVAYYQNPDNEETNTHDSKYTRDDMTNLAKAVFAWMSQDPPYLDKRDLTEVTNDFINSIK